MKTNILKENLQSLHVPWDMLPSCPKIPIELHPQFMLCIFKGSIMKDFKILSQFLRSIFHLKSTDWILTFSRKNFVGKLETYLL